MIPNYLLFVVLHFAELFLNLLTISDKNIVNEFTPICLVDTVNQFKSALKEHFKQFFHYWCAIETRTTLSKFGFFFCVFRNCFMFMCLIFHLWINHLYIIKMFSEHFFLSIHFRFETQSYCFLTIFKFEMIWI